MPECIEARLSEHALGDFEALIKKRRLQSLSFIRGAELNRRHTGAHFE
jgi:hypothetical protein